MEKKVEERREKKTRGGEVGVMNRRLETDHIQSQQTKGRLKGSNVKGLQHF